MVPGTKRSSSRSKSVSPNPLPTPSSKLASLPKPAPHTKSAPIPQIVPVQKSTPVTKSAPLPELALISKSSSAPKPTPLTKSTSLPKSAPLSNSAPLPKTEPLNPPQSSDRTGSTSPKRARTDATDGNEAKKRVKIEISSKAKDVPPTSAAESPKKDSKTERKPRRSSLTSDIRRDWDRMPVASQQGFENITGAICYRNAAVQALFHIPGFVNWVMDHLQPEKCVAENKKDCVSCCLHLLATKYWAGAKLNETWRRFHTILRRKGWGIDAGNGQADAGEQLIWIFDTMSKELPTETYAHLSHLFRIASSSIVSCGSCGHKSSSNPGNQYILNIALQRNITTLSENISSHLTPELLTDYKCESCGKTKGNRKYVEITRLPELICVQLNRIGWNRKTGRPVMNRSAIGIPTVLDMSSHLKRKGSKISSSSSSPNANTKQHQKKMDDNLPKIEYELLSVVKHSGSAAGGHYICAAVGPDANWRLFDDRSVTRSSAVQATRGGGFDPFIMYYQRKRG
ncbi:hypothetical protein VTL71DRAFT_2475 [Oculimacula yallundae]|uniref:USP domain-containing protein n=1 Tax=Oculimacula yallundae TaxID=86028 RepID=A0ABR4C953_9HELO